MLKVEFFNSGEAVVESPDGKIVVFHTARSREVAARRQEKESMEEKFKEEQEKNRIRKKDLEVSKVDGKRPEDVVCRAALQTALHIGFFLRSAQRVLFAQLFLKESAIGFRVSVVACANTDGRVFRIADPLVNERGSDTILYF